MSLRVLGRSATRLSCRSCQWPTIRPRLLVAPAARCLSWSPLRQLQDDSAASVRTTSTAKEAPSQNISKDEITAYARGTHPALHEPLETRELGSLVITTHAAPYTGHIALMTLNEPRTSNALSKNMLQELAAEVEAIHAAPSSSPLRALVLSSASDKAFCAGANLKERASMTPDETQAFLTKLRHTFTRLATLPIPCIAAVHGAALGGGLELAMCATLRVCSSNAMLGLPEAALGIVPGAGGTHRAPALIGRSRSLELMLTGRRLNGIEALEWGLCNAVVDVPAEASPQETRTSVRDVAMGMASRIALQAPLSIRAVLQTANDPQGGQEAEDAAYDSLLHTEDRTEALRAFAEKRSPIFRGR